MALLLGIDTGGTYTDAVLFREQGGVMAAAKALTTRFDLSQGIEEAIRSFPSESLARVEMVSLSTTLATNAIVEGRRSVVCLILIGYPEDALSRAGLGEAMSDDPVYFIHGGHTVEGDEERALDEEAVGRIIDECGERVSAFAVSGYFGVKNPTHENRVRALLRGRTGKPVTCGHELTSNLHASRRALTAAFNARLIPLLQDLILSVGEVLARTGINAPLMVVKGDGSLMDSRFALEYPIETILSGPAASVVGATFLSGLRDSLVSDMGGTTTDVAILKDGMPILNTEGAVVGGHHLMVEAVQIFTFGLGGDSEVRFSPEGDISIGPRRVVPLSLAARDNPGILAALKNQAMGDEEDTDEGCFVLPGRRISESDREREELSRSQRAIMDAAGTGPQSFSDLVRTVGSRYLLLRDLDRLVSNGIVALSGFTPSDAAHVLENQKDWCREAAEAGARLAARKSRFTGPEAARELCRAVMDRVCEASAEAILEAALAEGHEIEIGKDRRFFSFLTSAAFTDRAPGLVKVSLGLDRKIVGIGAPAATYYPRVGKLLATETVIPPYAEVANAVGAVAGNVLQKITIVINPRSETGDFRVHFTEGVRDFPELAEAVRFAEEQASAEAEALAGKAGAVNPKMRITREDKTGRALDGDILLEVRITATAAGRPRMGHGARSGRTTK